MVSLKEFVDQIQKDVEDDYPGSSESRIDDFIMELDRYMWEKAPRDKKGYPPQDWMNATNEAIKFMKGEITE